MVSNIFDKLQNYMLTETNIQQLLKTIINHSNTINYSNTNNNTNNNNTNNNNTNNTNNTNTNNNNNNNNNTNNTNNTNNNNTNNNNTNNNNNNTNNNKSTLFIPNQQDTLFWCFYIIKNGEINYQLLNNKNFILAMQLKIELVIEIRKYKDIFKKYKFDTISNIESNLGIDKYINIKTFLVLCSVSNINIIYIHNKTYYELLMNDSNKIYIINQIQNENKYNCKYGYELASENSLNNIKNTLFKIENINKPIKSITFYKILDLINICKKLEIEIINKDTNKNKSKNELYEIILTNL